MNFYGKYFIVEDSGSELSGTPGPSLMITESMVLPVLTTFFPNQTETTINESNSAAPVTTTVSVLNTTDVLEITNGNFKRLLMFGLINLLTRILFSY